eukprot:TRINITY_DN1961_c0_g1_i3.p1 TRINITY_DN1961_c0_g1~~TRINITY_DN1961_c0_g1_i3.p1  ORF type:complete len:735 (-),score=103.84 TRINITY_DN1961_c0_g1_i3:565-2769(-)
MAEQAHDAAIDSSPNVAQNTPDISKLATERAENLKAVLHNRRPLQRLQRQLRDVLHEPVRLGPLALKLMVDLMPIFTWSRNLSLSIVGSDIVAGITVAVLAVPEGISYAKIAGLPPQHGLYSMCVAALVYGIFGPSPRLSVGCVALISLFLHEGLEGTLNPQQCPAWYQMGGENQRLAQSEVCPEAYTNMAILTTLVVGIIMTLARFLGLEVLASFLGHPVISGFISGSSIIIAMGQVRKILGVKATRAGTLHKICQTLWEHIQETQPVTLCLGLSFTIALIVCKKLAHKYKRLTFLGTLAPLVSCIVGILLLWLCAPLREKYKVDFVGDVPKGLMPLSFSAWDFQNFLTVLPVASAVSLVSFVESFAMVQVLAAKHATRVSAGQELFALGMVNLFGSMLSCYPMTGAISRSTVNDSSGARSQFAGVVQGLLTFLVMVFLTPLFYYLPEFVLAAIVIAAVSRMFRYDEALELWRIKKRDFAQWMAAFLGTLFLGPLKGIALAVVLSLLLLLYETARPQITVLWRVPDSTVYRNVKQESQGVFTPNILVLRPGSSMFFMNAAFIQTEILSYVEDLEQANRTEYIVLEMTSVVSVDSTALHAIQRLVEDLRGRGIQLAFAMVGNRLEKIFHKSQFIENVGETWFFTTVHEAVTCCLKDKEFREFKEATRSMDSMERGDIDGGDTEGGDTEGGDTEFGDTEGGDTEFRDTEGGDAEFGDTEGGDTEGGDAEGECIHV